MFTQSSAVGSVAVDDGVEAASVADDRLQAVETEDAHVVLAKRSQ